MVDIVKDFIFILQIYHHFSIYNHLLEVCWTSNMYTDRINLHKQISTSQKILREKFMKFKRGEHQVQDKVNKVFKPIIEPLNKLVESSNVKKKQKLQHSTPEASDISDEDDTEDDEAWKFATANQTDTYDFKGKPVEDNSQNFANHPFQHSSKTSNEPSLLIKDDRPKMEPANDKDNDKNYISNNGADNISHKERKSIARYLNQVKNKDSRVDMAFGVRKLTRGYKFGDSSFSHDGEFFKIKGEKYKITPGLTELMFQKQPNPELLTEEDIDLYRNLVVRTNANRKNYKADKSPRIDKSNKFQTYLADLITGSGFKVMKKDDVTEYVYWDDPNELVERLKLLDGEKAAGNNNHDNEIQNILEELKEYAYI